MSPVSSHVEICTKCQGTGTFLGYSGRAVGQCFTCKGTGTLSFRTSPQQRAQSAANRAGKADRNWSDFRNLYPEQAGWLEGNAERWPLAASLVEAVRKYGDLTEKQMAVVNRGLERDADRQATRQARQAEAPPVTVDKLEAAFARARGNAAADGEGVRWLRMRLDTFTFSDAPANGQWPAAIFVKGEDGTKLGRIQDGRFKRNMACDDATQDRVLAAVADPEAGVQAYGQRTGRCSICGATLTAEQSRARSVGPICWGKFFG